MPNLENDTFLRALNREPTPWTPVWLMRQAGRYLPEYNVTRSKAGSFLALAQTPSLATEVTLQPIERYPLDAAILFSDILTVPDAMGLGLSFADGEGPRFARTTADEAAIRALGVPDMSRLRYVFDAVRELARSDARLACLRDIRLFDLYRAHAADSRKVAEADANALLIKEKSLAFRIVLQDTEKTLSDTDADAAISALVDGLKQAVGAKLRQ